MMHETEWTRKVCRCLEGADVPIVITVLSAGARSQHGVSDRHFNSRVWQGFIEFKGVDTKVGRTQSRFIWRQNLVTPGSAYVWRQVDVKGGLEVIVEDEIGVEVARGHCCFCLLAISQMAYDG